MSYSNYLLKSWYILSKLLSLCIWNWSLLLCCCLVAKSYPALCNPMDCSPPGFSVHGISEARILESVATFLLQGIFPTQDGTLVFCTTGRFFTTTPPRKAWSCSWPSFYVLPMFAEPVMIPPASFLKLLICVFSFLLSQSW